MHQVYETMSYEHINSTYKTDIIPSFMNYMHNFINVGISPLILFRAPDTEPLKFNEGTSSDKVSAFWGCSGVTTISAYPNIGYTGTNNYIANPNLIWNLENE